MDELERAFRRAVGNEVNPMTPRIVGYYKIAHGVAELSVGDGMLSSGKLWGVTVVQDGKHDTTASRCFYKKGLAKTYIETL